MASPTAPTIDANGITAPSFAEILAYLQTQYRGIFGQDVYLGNDSQDGQFLGIIAAAINDCNSAAIAAYNSFSPSTAQGNGLSNLVKINGIKRNEIVRSTVDVMLTGVAGTTINNGVVADSNNINWALPATVTIPDAGQITVTAVCQKVGNINAAIGSVNKIQTATYGWQSVTNPTVAVEGNPIESDAELRVRQSISVALPSQTMFEGIVGSVANLTGVKRIKGYENDTSVPDSNGIPGHTIALIVEGGDTTTIAQTIAEKKTPGTGTFGSISTALFDSVGSSHIIKFSRPTEAVIKVNLSIHGEPGFSAGVVPTIKQSIVDYLNSLQIGSDVIYTKLFVPANLDNTGYGRSYNIMSMTIARDSGAFGSTDIPINFDEVASAELANINITVI